MSILNQTRKQIDSMVGQLAADNSPVVKIVSVEPVSNRGFARVVASVAKATVKDNAHALQAVAAHLNNKMRIVPDSFTVLASDSLNTTVTGVLSANPETVTYQEGMEGFRAVAGNMFLDDDSQAWSLHKTVAGDVLIRARTRADDEIVTEVMQSVSSAQVGTAAADGMRNYQNLSRQFNGLEGGDFIVYVDPNKEAVVFGAVASGILTDEGSKTESLIVVASGDSEYATIDRKMVLGVFDDVDISDEGLVNESVAANGASLDEITSYYSRMFQRSPEYAAKFIALWKSHSFQ